MTRRSIPRAARCVLIAVLAVSAGPARAFHEGGVGACEGCHTMHGTNGTAPGAYLLSATDASSVCLNCHADLVQREYTVLSTNVTPGYAPVNYSPGGDFGWLAKSFAWTDGKGTAHTSPGENHGHNVVAAQYGLTRDTTRLTSPGGLYPSDKLSCISCHDPHGRYRVGTGGTVTTSQGAIRSSGSYGAQPSQGFPVGTYRLLAGLGYTTKSAPLGPAFVNPPPTAVAPVVANRSERLAQVRVAYGSGMSEWCTNCHGALHTPYATGTTSSFQHPSGASAKLSRRRIATIYNAYVKTGDLSGAQMTSYTSLVPYEEGSSDTVALSLHARSDGTASDGPGAGTENVMCLSCHRAHASGWDSGLRWNQQADALVVGGRWPGLDAGGAAGQAVNTQGRMTAETRAAMYDREPTTFGSFQSSLCNKCHAK
jgi:predicted CXXCH cytochrome family protein